MTRQFLVAAVRLARKMDQICLRFSILFMVVMLVSVLIQIVARYIFQSPPAWTEELGRYAMIWAAMFGATCAYYRRADPVLFRPQTDGRPGLRIFFQTAETLAIMIFMIPALYYMPDTLMRHLDRKSESLEISLSIIMVILPISFLIVLYYAVLRLLSALFLKQSEGME